MRIVEWDQLAEPERRAALARPAQESRAEVAAQVLEIISAVRHQGDAALRSYTERFDGVQLEALAVPRSEFIQARRSLAARQIAALECAMANVHAFHSAQVMQPLALETMPGVRCERIIR
ncbi:MAG: histidinol dehydrogenase, partial [Gammaproteobacteria bacterium]